MQVYGEGGVAATAFSLLQHRYGTVAIRFGTAYIKSTRVQLLY